MDREAPSLKWLFFSFQGRIARRSFFFGMIFLIFPQILCVIQMLRNEHNEDALGFWALVFLVIAAISIWSMLALFAKRLHDISMTGWLALIAFVPTLSWISFLVLTFIPSKQETNQWGPPPFPVDDSPRRT